MLSGAIPSGHVDSTTAYFSSVSRVVEKRCICAAVLAVRPRRLSNSPVEGALTIRVRKIKVPA